MNVFAQSLIIIPTYNEALNVHSMIERIFHLYPGISVLIIDDNSPDKTSMVVETMKTLHPSLYLIKREGKLGLGTAYLEGFTWALLKKFQYIIQMDCDFSHDPSDVRHLLEAVSNGHADMAIGSRYSGNEIRTKNWPIYRLLLSYFSSFILRLLTSMKIKDISGGFKAFRRSTLEKINFKKIVSKGYVFQFEINYKVNAMDLTIVEVPIIFYQRTLGVSKMNSAIVIEAVKIFIYLKYKKIIGQLN